MAARRLAAAGVESRRDRVELRLYNSHCKNDKSQSGVAWIVSP